MKTDKKKTKNPVQKYLVIVPHKETRNILQKYRDNMIENGLKSVYSFPCVAPIKELEHPMKPEELKKYARELREEMGNEKFEDVGVSCSKFNELILNGILTQRRSGAADLIGLLLTDKKDLILSEMPNISFRAAAVANFYIKRISPTSLKWKIGKLYWLPKNIKK